VEGISIYNCKSWGYLPPKNGGVIIIDTWDVPSYGFIAIRLMSNSGDKGGDVIPGNLVGQPR
jgi:hypothetical protein